MELMPVHRFLKFQTAMVTSIPVVKCIIPMYSQDSCYPKCSENTCHDCGWKWEDNQNSE